MLVTCGEGVGRRDSVRDDQCVGNNQIVVYHRAQDGTLTLIQTIATGGGGGGVQLNPPVDSLGSQGSLQLDSAHRRLFAVNTESLAANTQDCQVGTITSFLVASDGSLTFADRVMSGGLYPDSLTINKNLLFVLNSGGPGADSVCGIGPNITGFTVSKSGYMSFRSNSMQEIDPGALDGTGSGENCNLGGFPVPAFNCGRNPPAFPRGPAQVRFHAQGQAVGRDGQRDQLDLRLSGQQTWEDRHAHDNAGPGAGAIRPISALPSTRKGT